jgi:serine/threonine protein phosphatase PrpC
LHPTSSGPFAMAMSSKLNLSAGQYSDKGRKAINQDCHGIRIPEEPQLSSKGIAVALADGISSSDVGHVASESAIKGFLEDYYCTSESWSVKRSARRVLAATNSWLHSQTRHSPYRYDKDRGYVCALSALIIKATTAHILHVGDSRVYRLRNGMLEQLTSDHRLVVSQEESYLSRALGIDPEVDIDYRALSIGRATSSCSPPTGSMNMPRRRSSSTPSGSTRRISTRPPGSLPRKPTHEAARTT